AQLPVDWIQLEGDSCRADGVQVPRGGEQLVVDGAAPQEQRDLRRREALLQLLGRREHASIAERCPQVSTFRDRSTGPPAAAVQTQRIPRAPRRGLSAYHLV